MIKTVIIGAAGRMGRRLVALTAADPELELVGALDIVDVGRDAGELAGVGTLGIKVGHDFADIVGEADAAIDFTTFDQITKNLRLAIDCGCSYVIGTTGLDDQEKQEIANLATQGRVVFAPNMSVGVNLLFSLCAQVGRILGDDYDIEVVEMHHNQKKDAPSGTAARLGEILAEARELSYDDDIHHGREGNVGARTKQEIGMHALRGGDVVGEHTVIFATNGERIELTHKASSRDTFAKGAIRAVKFLANAENGLYSMQDVLGLT